MRQRRGLRPLLVGWVAESPLPASHCTGTMDPPRASRQPPAARRQPPAAAENEPRNLQKYMSETPIAITHPIHIPPRARA